MLQRSRLSKKLLVGLLGISTAFTVVACSTADPNSVSESPATTESPMADSSTMESPMSNSQSPMASDSQSPAADSSATSNETLDEVLAKSDSFTTLEKAIQAAGLEDTLKGAGPYTIFAPSDAAFAALPPETLNQLLQPENKETLKKILSYHVVPSSMTSANIAPGSVKTVEGQSVTIANDAQGITVDGAKVVEPDISASNGVIHTIDKVLLPPDLKPQ